MKASDVIAVATKEIGYLGKKSNAMLDDPTANTSGKWNKYARDLWMDGDPDHYYVGNKNGYDYCCVFKDWCFYEAAGKDKAKATAVCPVSEYGASVGYIKCMFPGRVDRIPAKGDIVLFKDKSGLCHTGLVAGVDGDTITTIEGNVDPTWHKVAQKTYKLSDGYIDSFCHPYYDENDDPENWFKDMGYTMDEFRKEVAAMIEPRVQYNRGDVVALNEGVTTYYNRTPMASFVYDGRPLYVLDSDYLLTGITIDPTLSARTGTVNTADIHLREPDGVITFINNEDTPEPVDPEALEHLGSILAAADDALLDTFAQMEAVQEDLAILKTNLQDAIDALEELTGK